MTDNSAIVDNDNDLTAFEQQYYNQKVDEPVVDEEVTETDALATEDDTDAPEGDEGDDDGKEEVQAPEESDEDDEDDEPKPEPKKNRKSYQERINELTAKAREAERREAALRDELAKRDSKREESKEEEPTPLRAALPPGAPHPDAKTKDGEPVYPLGEFDPAYIFALSRFANEQTMKEAAAERAKQEALDAQKAVQDEIRTVWTDNLEKAEEEIPDIRDKISELTSVFGEIEPSYGEYLATTLMQSEVGPKIMYYLSQNIGEAQKIVASGPVAATLAIGRLEAKLLSPVEEKKRNSKRVSDAPAPAPAAVRGTGTRTTVAPDTNDLNAFEREFYKK